MHYDIDNRTNNNKFGNGLHCNGSTRIYSEIGKMNVKENGMQELTSVESTKSKKSYRHSTDNLHHKSFFTSFDHLMSNLNLRKNKANSNSQLSYANKVNNFNRNEKFNVDKKTNIKSSMHSSRKSSNPSNLINKSEKMGRSESRTKSSSFIKRLSFRFKSNSTDSPQISMGQTKTNYSDYYKTSVFNHSNSLSIESNQKTAQEKPNLNLESNLIFILVFFLLI